MDVDVLSLQILVEDVATILGCRLFDGVGQGVGGDLSASLQDALTSDGQDCILLWHGHALEDVAHLVEHAKW